MDKYTNHKIRYVDIKKVTIPRGFFNQDLNVPKLFDWLYSQPEADGVEVVRCENCKLRDTEGCPFAYYSEYEGFVDPTKDDDFCSYGKKEED